jgi:hypothetical protein
MKLFTLTLPSFILPLHNSRYSGGGCGMNELRRMKSWVEEKEKRERERETEREGDGEGSRREREREREKERR